VRIFLVLSSLGALLLAAGCGGGSSHTSNAGGNPVTPPTTNAAAVLVNPGPANTVNIAFVSVTVCVPGTSTCQTIPNIQVDTGSSGLRLIYSTITQPLALPAQTVNGNPVAECMQFADGFSWGAVRLATVQVANEQATNIPIQIIADPSMPTIPQACQSTGVAEQTPSTFGANGILGLSPFIQDCGPGCAVAGASNAGFYYVCASTGCGLTDQPAAVALAQQVPNPVASFTTDNNGVSLQLPAIPSTGANNVSGSLVFGIGTQSNNGLGSAQVFPVDPNYGLFTVSFNGISYADGIIDSGSNGIFFTDVSSTPTCFSANFYCPGSAQSLSATNIATNNSSGKVTFTISNASTLFSSGNAAFNNLGGPNSDPSGFDWGLPFHFGRNVYTAIEGRSTPGGTGPYFAY
jgi:hypothetical protein